MTAPLTTRWRRAAFCQLQLQLSFYYGRVLVANAFATNGNAPGNQVGIIKCNADGSAAEEGGFSTGGLSWGYDPPSNLKYSPWKMAICADDTVYIDDFSANGVVYGFDQTIDPNTRLEVVAPGNYPYYAPEFYPNSSPDLSGLCVTGTGTNKEIWMSDANYYTSAGIVRWQITGDGTVAVRRNDKRIPERFGKIPCIAQ